MRTRATPPNRWASATLSENDPWAEAPFIKSHELYNYDMETVYGSPSGQWAFLEVVEQAPLD